MKKDKRKKKLPKAVKIVMFLTIILSIIFTVLLFKMNVLPLKFFIAIVIILFIFDAITLLFLKSKKKRKVGLIISLIINILYLIGIYYIGNTLNFFSKIFSKNVIEQNYVVVVNSKSEYNEIKDLKDKKIGFLNSEEEGLNKAKDKLKKEISYTIETNDDSNDLTDNLLKDKLDAYVIEESQEKILEENYNNYRSKTKIIYRFSVEVKDESITKAKNVTKESFNIYISGIDTYGKINSSSRSDVNIVVSVNPKTGKISLIHIPRDYYVKVYRKEGYKDKLTHAGIYGIDTSVKTIEELLDIDINYYFKFNFTSLIDIVDALGGIKVYSEVSFDSGLYDENTTEIYHYVKGYNTLNGKEALSFARERHNLIEGDRARGAHQEAIIEAIIEKIKNPSIITKYTTLLSKLSDKFITNMDETTITNFIKYQVDKNINWEVTKLVLDGTNSYEYTYSYPKTKLYVMLPTEEELNKAKEQINNNNN